MYGPDGGSATPYKINTITVTGGVACVIDIQELYNGIEIMREDSSSGVIYTEHGKNKQEMVFRGFSKKSVVKKRVTATAKRFDNQVTIVYKIDSDHTVNVKVFRNGNVQMTGVKFERQGYEMVDTLIEMIRRIQGRGFEVVVDTDALRNINYKICMMNSNFVMGFPVRRDKLYDLMRESTRLSVSFESCIYSGVKILYFYNGNQSPPAGTCRCVNTCYEGKGSGCGEGQCKKVTIAVFQSGAVIITGAQSTEQIDEVYAFITGTLTKNRAVCQRIYPEAWNQGSSLAT